MRRVSTALPSFTLEHLLWQVVLLPFYFSPIWLSRAMMSGRSGVKTSNT